jgi:hypothetical protein
VRIARHAVAFAGFSLAFGIALILAPPGRAQGTIWAECISGSFAQTCQESSWYTGPVAVVWRASPSPEQTTPCLLGIEYAFEKDSVNELACTAKWRTEGTDTKLFTMHVEASSPVAETLPDRPPDFGGWYNHPVAITFKGHGYSGPAACRANGASPTVVYAGPDALSAAVNATCVDPAGKSVSPSFGLRYDATPPTITGAFPARSADYSGWYNHPVTFVFTGTDAMSGMEPCSATYAGPDDTSAEVTGTCHDRAGNLATFAAGLHYQSTPPPLTARASAGDGMVALRWRASTSVAVVRSPGLRGPAASKLYEGAAGSFTDRHPRNGERYTYTLTAKDRAGNRSSRTFAVTPGPRLLAPAANERVTAAPLLRWTPVKGAGYYNVQLYRGRKLLSIWPVRSSLQLNRVWRYAGNEYKLTPGRYSWYVWPGLGRFAAARYGPLIGHRTFVVQSPTSR